MQNDAKHIERIIIPMIDFFNVLFMIFNPNSNRFERLEYFCTWIDNFHCLLQFIMIVVIHFGASKNDPVPNDYYKPVSHYFFSFSTTLTINLSEYPVSE